MRGLASARQVRIGGAVVLGLDESFGQGGEAEVFGVAGEPHLAVKLLRTPGGSEYRLADHLGIRATEWIDDQGMPRLAWPIARAETLLTEPEGDRYEGHVMLRLPSEEWLGLDALISGKDRASLVVGHFLRWDELLVIAQNLAELVADMHDAKPQIIAADLKTKNALVARDGNNVALVDCDSMIVRDHDSNGHAIVRMAPPISEETVPPELLEDALATRNVNTDAWAVAIIVCTLLMDGQHPFSGTPGRGVRRGNHSVTENVLNGRTIFKPRNSLKLTHPVYPRVLPVELLELATKCFVEGHGRPSARPTPRDWAKAIATLGPVGQCERLPMFDGLSTPTNRHRFSGHLGTCPWCQLMTVGAPDPFPEIASNGGNP